MHPRNPPGVGPALAARHGEARGQTAPCRSGHIELTPRGGREGMIVALLRFIGAAYETGDAACWEAAHARAEDELGSLDGALLVAAAAVVVRTILSCRDFGFLPPPCRRLSDDETALLHFLRTLAKRGAVSVETATRILNDPSSATLLVAAAARLVAHAPYHAGELTTRRCTGDR